MKKFGEKLRLLRQQAGMSQTKLANILQVNQSHVARIEKGLKPSVDIIIQISYIFDVSLDLLMKDDLELD